jgi:hypothetical protein
MIAEPDDGAVYPLNAKPVFGERVAVAVTAHTPDPRPNFLRTSRMPLQCI